ncbi:hypothetical protein CRX72_22115 [Pantoea sp. BRM17]|nr:hypothetical protein CRX72_22115 [Pantoea sp. BRM17]
MSWRTLTYFGDSMLLIPTAVIIALVLPWKSSSQRTVWYWLLAFGPSRTDGTCQSYFFKT